MKGRKSVRGGKRESLAPNKQTQFEQDSDECINAFRSFERKIDLTKKVFLQFF